MTRVISGMPAGIISELNESMWRHISGSDKQPTQMSIFLTCALGVCVKHGVSNGETWPLLISLYYTFTQKQVYYIIRVFNDFPSHLNECHYHLQNNVFVLKSITLTGFRAPLLYY